MFSSLCSFNTMTNNGHKVRSLLHLRGSSFLSIHDPSMALVAHKSLRLVVSRYLPCSLPAKHILQTLLGGNVAKTMFFIILAETDFLHIDLIKKCQNSCFFVILLFSFPINSTNIFFIPKLC